MQIFRQGQAYLSTKAHACQSDVAIFVRKPKRTQTLPVPLALPSSEWSDLSTCAFLCRRIGDGGRSKPHGHTQDLLRLATSQVLPSLLTDATQTVSLDIKGSPTAPSFFLCSIISNLEYSTQHNQPDKKFFQGQDSISTMQISGILITLAFAATALAACPAGPYSEGGSCAGACGGAQTCSKNTDRVVRTALGLLLVFSLSLSPCIFPSLIFFKPWI